jgi:hypothetical protein
MMGNKHIMVDSNPYQKGSLLTNENYIPDNIKCRLKAGNIQFLLYGCETCSLTLREEQKLRLFENTSAFIFMTLLA